MTEAQMQLLLDRLEGLRIQFSNFQDLVLLELEGERLRSRKILAEVARPELIR